MENIRLRLSARIALLISLALLLTMSCSLFTPTRPTATPAGQASTLTASPAATRPPAAKPYIPAPACQTAESGAVTQDSLGDLLYPDLGNGGYDSLNYDLTLNVAPPGNQVDATIVITLKALQPLDAFNLDYDGPTISAVQLDGEAVDYQHAGHELTITPKTAIAAGATFTVTARYQGSPKPYVHPAIDLSSGWNNDSGTIYAANEPAGAASWYPVNDMPCDKATYRFTIRVPKGDTVAANGTLAETSTSGDQATYVWVSDDPIASYLVTVGIGQFKIVKSEGPNGLPLRSYFETDIADQIAPKFERTGEMIALYNRLFGQYPFDAYGALVINQPLGYAMETQTLSLFGVDMVNDDNAEGVVAHELAHQWFGNAITIRQWDDIWLNEGFATYAESLWVEETQGKSAANRERAGWHGFLNTRDFPPPSDPPAGDLFNPSVYLRGALALHAIRVKVGDEAFFEVLQTYYQRYQNATVTSANFIALVNEVSGVNVEDLMQQWLYEQTLPAFPT
jgi:aminopeptidase N